VHSAVSLLNFRLPILNKRVEIIPTGVLWEHTGYKQSTHCVVVVNCMSPSVVCWTMWRQVSWHCLPLSWDTVWEEGDGDGCRHTHWRPPHCESPYIFNPL